MVFHGGNQHLVAGPYASAAESLRDEINALGGPANKDDLARFSSI